MTKWELARYLIDAKKCVDSVLFIAENVKDLRNLSLRDIVEERQRKFYINVKVIYDKSLSLVKRKELKKTDEVYEATCFERDKNYAHKDESYVPADFESISQIASILKLRLIHCFEVCRNSLPDVVTLDFIDYDRDLYRYINKIDPETEEKILKAQHPGYGVEPTKEELERGITRKVFYDTEDLKKIGNASDYAVLFKSGLTVREGVQERQDSSIRINVLFGRNVWASLRKEALDKMKKAIEECPESPFLY